MLYHPPDPRPAHVVAERCRQSATVVLAAALPLSFEDRLVVVRRARRARSGYGALRDHFFRASTAMNERAAE